MPKNSVQATHKFLLTSIMISRGTGQGKLSGQPDTKIPSASECNRLQLAQFGAISTTGFESLYFKLSLDQHPHFFFSFLTGNSLEFKCKLVV